MLTEIVLGGAVLLLILWMVFAKPSGLPPGRWGLPLIGYIPRSGTYIDDTLMDLQKQYGDIYIWRFGTRLQVYVHDYNMCRQMFASPDFIDRPDMDVMKFRSDIALGIAGSNGAIWHTNRRFSLRQLRDRGMGKSGLVSAVHDQALNLLEALKECAGKTEPITPALNTAIINILWKMVANTQFENDDARYKSLQKLMGQVNASLSSMAIVDMMPWIKSIVPSAIMRRMFQVDALEEAKETVSKYFQELIKEHLATLDPDDPKDLMDAYLIEMEEQKKDKEEEKKENDDNEDIRSEEDLMSLIFDLFFAGTDSIFGTMKWIFLYLATYPEVQRKMQQEIDQFLPNGILATLEDRLSMPYTEAVINEIIRKSSLSNIGLHHVASRDTTLAGYNIPKGTLITSATVSIHSDPRYWEEPDSFLPERWLNPEGNFVMKKEGYLPFGNGKRACIGETLARMEIFILTTAVFQTFSIAPPKGKSVDLLPSYDVTISHDPREQDVVFTLRN